MKKISAILIVLTAAAAGVFGQQFRVTGQWSAQDADSNVFRAIDDGVASNKWGLGTEFILKNVGFGSAALISCEEITPDVWTTYWDLRTYISYHFFKGRRFFDPFMQAGVGGTGNFDFEPEYCEETEEIGEVSNVDIALYPYLGAGFGLQFRGGLYASGQFNWRPVSGDVPYTCDEIGAPDFREYEFLVAVGYSFGDRR